MIYTGICIILDIQTSELIRAATLVYYSFLKSQVFYCNLM